MVVERLASSIKECRDEEDAGNWPLYPRLRRQWDSLEVCGSRASLGLRRRREANSYISSISVAIYK